MQEEVKGEHIALAAPSHPDRNLPFTEPLRIPVRVFGLLRPLVLELDSGINSPLLFDAGKLRTAAFAARRCIVAAPTVHRMPTRFCRPRTYRWDSTPCSKFLSRRSLPAIKTFPMRGSMACCRPLSSGAHSSATRIALLCLSRDEELEALSSRLRRNALIDQSKQETPTVRVSGE
jgi:hypothetical protein